MNRALLLFLFLSLTYLTYAQPSNDECSTLIDLGIAPLCDVTNIYNNVDATASVISSDPNLNIPSCFSSTPDADVWFAFQVPSDGSIVDFQVCLEGVPNGPNGSIVQPQVGVYRGDCPLDELQELACVSALPGENSVEILLLGLTPGFTYYLRVEDWSATAASNAGDFTICVKEPDVEFTMGTDASTSLCNGTLFDSGGPDANYSNGENNTFTICPTEPFACIEFDVTFDTEQNFDFLNFFAGDNTNAPLFVSFDGTGGPSTFGIDTDCVTIQFTSDGSITDPGFEVSWNCSQTPCPTNFITCDNPVVIPTLPFDSDGLTTCGTLNDQTFGACPFGFDLLDGEDYIFTYNSPGDECISVLLENVNLNTAVSIYNDCPESSTECIGATITLNGNSSVISSAYLPTAGEYYIVVDNGSGCSGFDIYVETVDCPESLPPAALCEDALSINGCSNLPSLIQVDQEPTTEPDCIQTGVNNGGWGGIGQGHFTWFYFQSQADGNFGFLANNGNIVEDSDIDINVWGPIDSEAELCDFMKTNQPARSTWAADNADPTAFDFTGLIDINPIDGTPVTDTQEGAGGDGFVSTLPVDSGSWYLVLVNDFSGAIINGGIEMDFSPTSPGVLDPNPDNFTISQNTAACPNSPVQIEATGGSTYSWFPATGLSCTDCPDPIVTTDGSVTYQVAISTACSTDTLSVDIAFMEVTAGPDQVICLDESVALSATNEFIDVDWSWENPIGTLSCSDCPEPIVNTMGAAPGNYEFIVTSSNAVCSDSDTLIVTILDAPVPQYEIAENTTICIDENIDLGGPATAGVNYSWTSNVGGFTSSDSNPNVFPTETTTYYLEASNADCPNQVFDSVTVEVVEVPLLLPLSDQTLCPGEEYIIMNITTSPDVDYLWTPNNGIVGDPSLANNIFTPTETTTYTLTASQGDCSIQTSFTIVVNPIAEITVEDETICEGMSATLSASANANGTFTWLPDGTTGNTYETGNLDQMTTFTVSFVDDNGCAAVDQTVTVNVEEGVEITDLTVDPTTEITLGDEITLTANTNLSGNLTYDWSTGTTTTVNFTTAQTTQAPSETYSVTVTDENGCTDEATIEVEVSEPEYLGIPNAFTPNSDGVNDVFGPILNGSNVQIIDLRVYNRWGEKVYEYAGNDLGWDGTYKDQPAPSDVYAFILVLEFPDGERLEENGDVTLIR